VSGPQPADPLALNGVATEVPEGHRPDALRGMFGRDLAYLTVQMVQMATSFLLTPAQTRVLGPSGYGQLSIGIALCQLGSVVLCLGLHSAAQRRYHQPDGADWARRLLGTSMVLVVVVATVLVVSVPAWAAVVDAGRGHRLIMATVVVWSALAGLAVFALVVHRAADRLGWYVAVALVQGLLAPVLGLVVAAHGGGALAYLVTMAAVQGVATTVGLVAARPRVPRRQDLRRLGDDLRFAVPLVPQQASSILLAMGDRVVLERLLGSAANGRYSVAYAVGSLGITVASAVNQVWMTRVYSLGGGSADLAALAVARRQVQLLGAAATVGVAAGAPLLYAWFLPASFHGGGLALVTALVAVGLVPYGWLVTDQWTVLRNGATGRLAVVTLAAAAANLALNVVLVPVLGLVGSALATVLGYGALAIAVRYLAGAAPCAGRRWPVALAAATAMALAVSQSELPAGGSTVAVRLVLVTGSAAALLAVVHLQRRSRSSAGLLPWRSGHGGTAR